MVLKSLTLKNYRNHSFLSYDFAKGINIINGSNAAGKTNIVESIYYLTTAKSFRTQESTDLIKKDKKSAYINADILEGDLKRNISVTIYPESKEIYYNGKKISKIMDLLKYLNVVLFEPRDVMLFKGAPKERRDFLDDNLSKKSLPYADYLSRYEKALRERNELLKTNKPDKILLESSSEMLAKLAAPIVSYREMYLKDIKNILIKITRALAGACKEIEVKYDPFIPLGDDFIGRAKEAFQKVEEYDLEHGSTSIGPHREDFSLLIDGKDIGVYGSQGENRIMAIALKIAPYFLIEDKDRRPIVLLDDVMSELDESHSKRLVNFISKFEQVFITGTNVKINGATYYKIGN